MRKTKKNKGLGPEFHTDGYDQFNIWRHSKIVRDLYRERANNKAEEMTCAIQAVKLLAASFQDGDSILDAGCGSGYFFHSLVKRFDNFNYLGFDATSELIRIGKEVLPEFGLPEDRLTVCRIEDFRGWADHVICMNVLSNLDNYHKPLERLLLAAGKTLILRESIADISSYQYVCDDFLDDQIPLKVHVNTYARKELVDFVESYGFKVNIVEDERTAGGAENVIGYPHFWTFLVAHKI